MEDVFTRLAEIITQKSGISIDPINIFKANRHFHYLPETDPGRPLLLYYCYYNGSGMGVEMHSDDWYKLDSGIITPEEYVESSLWLYGYLWEGGPMITGGYIQPLEDIPGIHDKEKISRYMSIIICRGDYVSMGYHPSQEICLECSVKDCPYSVLKKKHLPMYVNILEAFDNRLAIYNAINNYLRNNYGYELNGLCASTDLGPDELMLYRNIGERTFELYLGDSLIKKLLYTPFIAGYDWESKIKSMKLFLGRRFSKEKILIESPQDFERAMIDLKLLRDWDIEEEQKVMEEELFEDDEEYGPIARFFDWILKTFCK